MGKSPDSGRTREALSALLAAIDAGTVRVSEREMLACAVVCLQSGARDLVFEFASRCENGRAVLKRIAN